MRGPQDVTRAFGQVTAYGFVFRVDLSLRLSPIKPVVVVSATVA